MIWPEPGTLPAVLMRHGFGGNRDEMPIPCTAVCRFTGIQPGDDRIPDGTAFPNFRHLLAQHGLTEAIFANVNTHLAHKA